MKSVAAHPGAYRAVSFGSENQVLDGYTSGRRSRQLPPWPARKLSNRLLIELNMDLQPRLSTIYCSGDRYRTHQRAVFRRWPPFSMSGAVVWSRRPRRSPWATVGLQRSRWLSDNGSSYIAGDLSKWLADRKIKHLRGAPYHPMTQGKIERWHQTLKNRILLQNYFLPGDLKAQIAAFVDDYNRREHRQSHPSRRLLRARPQYPGRTRQDQATDHCQPAPATSATGCLRSPHR